MFARFDFSTDMTGRVLCMHLAQAAGRTGWLGSSPDFWRKRLAASCARSEVIAAMARPRSDEAPLGQGSTACTTAIIPDCACTKITGARLQSAAPFCHAAGASGLSVLLAGSLCADTSGAIGLLIVSDQSAAAKPLGCQRDDGLREIVFGQPRQDSRRGATHHGWLGPVRGSASVAAERWRRSCTALAGLPDRDAHLL